MQYLNRILSWLNGLNPLIMAKKLNIKKAIKRPGRLTKMVGGPPSKNIGKVRRIAKTARSSKDRAAARFYLNALRPINKRNKKR